ncbi:hypothetical protein VitviT2T_010902 [Vitis vinifera]|uniref:Uncharacterized protein n=1 Tax=Vitis vinifera TaxID=29760 RepID=A0ABY9C9Z2_VITVI|nr:hypothetical protein VitviT2T_010902 [Vitis vinifera]
MDTKITGDILEHLERQHELLMETYESISNELHKLQVEEEMLMQKLCEVASAEKDEASTSHAHDTQKQTPKN